MAASATQKKQIRDVVLTHAHLDHIAGLPLFIDDLFASLIEPVRIFEELIKAEAGGSLKERTRQFNEQCGTTNAQFEFISFLDGHESEGKAVESGVEEFRKSWQRAKWHVLMQ